MENPVKKQKVEACQTIDTIEIKFEKDVEKSLKEAFGDENIEKITKSLKTPPIFTTIRTNIKDIEEAVKTLSKILNNKFEVEFSKDIPDCLWIKTKGPKEVKLNDHFVVVGKDCGESVLRGANVYAPGILGMSKTEKQISVLCETVSKTTITKGKKFSTPEKDFLLVGNGVLKMDYSEIFHTIKKGLAVKITDPIYESPSLDGINGEHFFVQNLPSIIVSHILDPQPGERIVDMCSAPGGKTSHICNLMGNKGEVIAFDKNRSKLKLLNKVKQEQKLEILKIEKLNATTALKSGYKEGSFDRVLLDAPCTGLGLRPCFEHKITLDEVKETASYQRRLLQEAHGLLKPGGTMVFSVCSFHPYEGEENVKWFLETYQDMELVQPQSKFLKYGVPGLKSILKDKFDHVLRFDPSLNHESIGFFLAKFVKKPK